MTRCEYCEAPKAGSVEVSASIGGPRGRFPFCLAHVNDAMRDAGVHLGRLRELIREELTDGR